VDTTSILQGITVTFQTKTAVRTTESSKEPL